MASPTPRLWLLLGLGALAMQCVPNVSSLPCATDNNCPEGFVCVAGQCAKTDGGATSGGGTAGGRAGGAGGGTTVGGGSAGGVGGGAGGGSAGGAVGGGSAGGVAGGTSAGGSAGGMAGGDAGGTAGGSAGGVTGGGTAGGVTGGGGGVAGGGVTGGGMAGGATGGGSGGGGCTRDLDCGPPTDCTWPRCQTVSGTCFQAFVDAGVLCRPSTGFCDLEERCTGASTACPPDRFVNGVQCAAATGPCELPASCNGLIPTCPVRPFVDAGVVCRGLAGPCDAEERCTGTSATCPVDRFAAGNACGGDAGACELQTFCLGTAVTCPPKPLVDAGVPCRQTDVCLPPQRCTGISNVCPPPPVPVPQRCDDGNPCSTGICGVLGCNYMAEPTVTSRALLANTLDAGVVIIRVPLTQTNAPGPFGQTTITVCGNTVPPRCEMQVLFSQANNFNTFVSSIDFQGSGTLPVLVPHISLTLDIPLFGLFQGGVALGAGGCAGPTPIPGGPAGVFVDYSFRTDEPDGGLLNGLSPPQNLDSNLTPNIFCWESGVDPFAASQAEAALRPFIANHLATQLEQFLYNNLRSELCMRPAVSGVCPIGSPLSTPSGPICIAGSQCVSGLRFRQPNQPTAPACTP